MPLSARQEYNLWHIMTGDIPAAAVIDWAGMTSLDRMEQQEALSRAPYTTVRQRVLGSQSAYFEPQNEMIHSLPGDMSVRNQKEFERSATTTNLYFAALERGDLASAFSLTSLDPALRRHWNARTQTLQQTSMVKYMLGEKDCDSAYMTNKERVTFYHKYIENARNKQAKAYNEYLLYMYMYGCVIHAILNSMLHAKGISLTESQYRVFLKALYDNADTFFNSSDFGKSFALTKNDKGEEVVNIGSGTKHIIPKSTNIEAAKQIREILHNKVGIDMSDIYISDKEIEDGYALTAEEGTKANKHKVAQDVMTKALLDSLEGKNTKAQEGEERLWIGRMLLGGGQ